MNNLFDMSPKDHVFESLKNLILFIEESENLNNDKEQLVESLKNVISWESQRVSIGRINAVFLQVQPL